MLLEACPDPDILAITIKPPAPNGDFLKVTPKMWRESIDTALIGPIELMRQYIPHDEYGLGKNRKHRDVFREKPHDLATNVGASKISADQLHSQRISRNC